MPRAAGGEKWWDSTLLEWPENDFRCASCTACHPVEASPTVFQSSSKVLPGSAPCYIGRGMTSGLRFVGTLSCEIQCILVKLQRTACLQYACRNLKLLPACHLSAADSALCSYRVFSAKALHTAVQRFQQT